MAMPTGNNSSPMEDLVEDERPLPANTPVEAIDCLGRPVTLYGPHLTLVLDDLVALAGDLRTHINFFCANSSHGCHEHDNLLALYHSHPVALKVLDAT